MQIYENPAASSPTSTFYVRGNIQTPGLDSQLSWLGERMVAFTNAAKRTEVLRNLEEKTITKPKTRSRHLFENLERKQISPQNILPLHRNNAFGALLRI